MAALRVGAGRLAVGAPAVIAPSLAALMPEARVIALRSETGGGINAVGLSTLRSTAARADAILCGPGMIDSKGLRDFVNEVIVLPSAPALVIDAAALHAVRDLQKVRRRKTPYGVVTPHAGEMARLVGADRRSVEADPAAFAKRLAQEANVVVVLKGAVTIIAHPDGQTWKHVSNAIGLATSGSGDVLAGGIAGFAARGAILEQAAVWGVAVHSLAGLALMHRYGGPGLLAREIAGEMPNIINSIGTKKPLSVAAA